MAVARINHGGGSAAARSRALGADRLVTELALGLRLPILDAAFIPVITRHG